MPIIELKCIEILLRFLNNDTMLKDEIYSEFEELETFTQIKNNLFNTISINQLLENYSEIQSFSLEYFFKTGIIPGMYNEETTVPLYENRYKNNSKKFYNFLIEALKREQYTFSPSNDIIIKSGPSKIVIPQIWLYRLSQAVKRTKYEKVYFYNKNKENNIIDKIDLIEYLRHTKTFIVELISSDPNIDYEYIFKDASSKTNNQFKNKREVKVNDIIGMFIDSTASLCNTKISKYKLTDSYWLIQKAEKAGIDFYTQPLEVQQQILNNWILEYINSKEKSQKETQKFILLADPEKIKSIQDLEINKEEVISGLFCLYMHLIKYLNLDYNFISLTSFKIESYLSEKTQTNLIVLNKLIKTINTIGEEKILSAEKLNNLLFEMKDSDEIAFKEKEIEYRELLVEYQEMELEEESQTKKRNILQKEIQIEQKDSIETIAFDNEKIIELLIKATKEGKIVFNFKTNKLLIELYNHTIGKVVFKTSIDIDSLISLIENINFNLEEVSNLLKFN